MLEGIFVEQTFMFPEHRREPIHPPEVSGIGNMKSIYRYSLKDIDYPILIIPDNISDSKGNIIPKGHYELALSDERDFLILIQSQEAIAVIPVFKVEENKQAFKEPSRKLKKIKKKEEKERKKTNEKRAKIGMPPDEEKIYMEAGIEYIKDGDYYLIKYEREAIRAWGAIKAD